MRKILILLLIIASYSSCKSSKKGRNSKVITKKSATRNVSKSRTTETSKITSLEEQIIDYAKTFEGVRYRWGGTDKSGMDCSGLVFETFKSHNIYLPRISRDMAKKGTKIKLKETKKGDLLFFKTGKNRRNIINHVGLVIAIKNNAIYFIHSTTSKGVIISSLNEDYWKSSFTEARRIL
ncbi:C40 family peptidase [uncultured Algibacter sp.]|uniref:C40 family peptidase n=1 Tax=uncultured Algibacter sp. TaxID=298659 RepID=UPI002628D03A|nr:C40 family peptidase [uncultured Algibacter sp.]